MSPNPLDFCKFLPFIQRSLTDVRTETITDAAMTACAKVLSTYELLENIILHLPLGDVLLVESVSNSFRGVIQCSSTYSRYSSRRLA